jgi:putative tryptophan/tyrosine transport system substrate-binding protein
MLDLRRRQFIALLGGAGAAWPVAALAQGSARPVVGYLGPGSAVSDAFRVTAFRQGLSEAGFVEGQNVTVDYRWAEEHYDRLPAMATDLVNRHVAVIVATSTPAALAAKAATTTIPIIFETAADPVKLGFVASLNRPGGNVTGVTQLGEEVLPKRLELLHELLPSARVMALLINPADPVLAEPQTRVVLSAAKTFGLELHVLRASSERDFDAVFAKLIELRAGGLVIGGSNVFTGHINQLAALTVRHAVPAIYQRREFAAAGGLMSYGSNIPDTHRIVGLYTGRILKGDNPANLPVQQASKVELYINFKTAKAFGLTVPLPLLGRADEVIE